MAVLHCFMKQGMIGKKVGMTSYHDTQGRVYACTVIESGPCVVTQIRMEGGVSRVQLAYGEKKVGRTTKPLLKHFEKAGISVPRRKLKEFSGMEAALGRQLSVGEEVVLSDLFQEGDIVMVQATSKGRGFQGVVKRHGFSGVGGRTHGQHNRGRAPGSIGAGSFPSRVFKGLRMAGRMGGATTTVRGLRVVRVIPEQHLVIVRGAVPGAENGLLTIRKQK